MFTDDELIKKKDIFDDDIHWKHNPFDVDSVDGTKETPEQLNCLYICAENTYTIFEQQKYDKNSASKLIIPLELGLDGSNL